MTSVEQTIVEFISNEILQDESEASLKTDRPLLDEGLLDSLALQQLVTFLEKKFSIEIDDDYLMPEYFESIGAMAKLVEELRT